LNRISLILKKQQGNLYSQGAALFNRVVSFTLSVPTKPAAETGWSVTTKNEAIIEEFKISN